MVSRLYDKRRWRRRSRAFLARNPLCRMCEEISKVTLATLVDHIVPRRPGGVTSFGLAEHRPESPFRVYGRAPR